MSAPKRGLGRGLEVLLADAGGARPPAEPAPAAIGGQERRLLLQQADELAAILDDIIGLLDGNAPDPPMTTNHPSWPHQNGA